MTGGGLGGGPDPGATAGVNQPLRTASASRASARTGLRSALGGLVKDPEAFLAREGIEATARAETLPPEAFCALARGLARLRGPRSTA